MRKRLYCKVFYWLAYTLDGTVRWADSCAVMISWEGKPATLNFLTDITERKQAEEERQQGVERLRKALGATVQAIAMTVETKDPYTAGHQHRVSDLARAIATQMNLPDHQINGLRMASKIHDIGKNPFPRRFSASRRNCPGSSSA